MEEVIIGRVGDMEKPRLSPFEGKAFLPNKSQVETGVTGIRFGLESMLG